MLTCKSARIVAVLIVLSAAVACGDDDTNNDNGLAAGSGGHGGSGGEKAGSGGSSGRGGSSEEDAGTAMSTTSLVNGTGESCQSYTPAMNGMCAGWYCGVNEDTLMHAVDHHATCGGNVSLLCDGTIVGTVANCARMIKSAMVSSTDEELRPMIETCAKADSKIQQNVSKSCVDCVIDSAACASDNCLAQCLAGDSPECDTCRRSHHCDQMVFSCGGLPAPIH